MMCIAFTTQATQTIISQGARNVKSASAYGGVSAVGDGVTDDTQAFLDALNKGRYQGKANTFLPVAIYVPPGTYLVKQTLIVWENTFLFGEPSSIPTIVLAANSPNFRSGANPFVVTASGYNMQPYSTNWSDRDGVTYASTNNIFYIDVHDINFTVRSGNPGCSDVYLFAMGQQGSLRNSVLTADTATAHCLRTDLYGGGGIVQGVICNGGKVALDSALTSMLFYRGCTFNGPVSMTYGDQFNFIACAFNGNFTNSGPSWFGMDDCTFASGTFSPGSGSYHIENTTLPTGHVAQLTPSTVYYNGASVSGVTANVNAAAKGSPYANPAYPRPTSACVNVKSYGATGNGVTDDTAAILAAYTASKEVFFPLGTYIVSKTITLGPGQKMFGQGVWSEIYETANVPALSVTGRGIGGVVINGISIGTATPATCLVWNGDQSSVVLDSEFYSEANSGTLTNFQTGGGFFENGWWPQDTLSTGMLITGTDPLYLYSVQPEHFTATAIVLNGAQNVYGLNLECETDPEKGSVLNAPFLSITNSSNIFIQGFVSGNYNSVVSYEVNNSASNVFIFGAAIDFNSKGVLEENGLFYGPSSPNINYSILNGYVRSNDTP
jgi:hypothetical protein